jgi:FOG: TPR repeat
MSSNRLQRAQFFADRGRTPDAIREYQAQLCETPDDGTVHGLLAIQFSNIAQFEPAMFHAREAIRCAPHCGFSHFAKGSVLSESGRLKEASDSIKAALQLEPESPAYFQVLASIEFSLKRRDSALNAIESSLRLAPTNVAALNLRASLLRIRGEHQEADRATNQALEANPESSLAHVNLGLSHISKGRYERAFGEFDEALRLDPNSTAAHAGINEVKSARAITVLYVFLALVGVFLAWVFTHGPSSGCTETAVAFTLVFFGLLLRRHVWPLISRLP